MNQKGLANIALIVLVIVFAGVAGYFALVKKSPEVVQQTSDSLPLETSTADSPASTPESYFKFPKIIFYENNLGTTMNPDMELFSYNLETKKIKQLTSKKLDQVNNPTYSTTSNLLAYIKLFKGARIISGNCELGSDETGDCVMEQPEYHVEIVTDTGKIIIQGEPMAATSRKLAFSPDGTKLAFLGDASLEVLDTFTGKKQHFNFKKTDGWYNIQPVWDADNTTIYLVDEAIYKINSSSGAISTLYEEAMPFSAKLAKLSPNNRTLAFILNDAVNSKNLYTNAGDEYLAQYDLATHTITKDLLLSNKTRSKFYLAQNGLNSVEQFLFSPDSTKVYFNANDEALPGLNVFDLKTKSITNVSSPAAGMIISFGRNANELIMHADGICAFDISKNKLRQLIPLNPI